MYNSSTTDDIVLFFLEFNSINIQAEFAERIHEQDRCNILLIKFSIPSKKFEELKDIRTAFTGNSVRVYFKDLSDILEK